MWERGSPAYSKSEMAKQIPGVLQMVSVRCQSAAALHPCSRKWSFCKFWRFIKENTSLGDSQELDKGMGSVSSSTKTSSHGPSHGEECGEGVRSLLAAGVEG